ncbi:MAG: HAMP domain-containing sensor histidine kinase, partial [Saprospiraceae bacterium]
LLQLARIESGVALLKKETVILSTVISAMRKKWQEAADIKKISLKVQIENDITVPGDKFYIELILDNLINNAIKYGKENGHVIITWNPVTKSLTIADDGEGIAKENLPHIFNRFYRTDESRSSIVKGSGLGLSIAKKLADLHHIALTVDSELGSGTTFSLQFPL